MVDPLWPFKHAVKERARRLGSRWHRWRYSKQDQVPLQDREACDWIRACLKAQTPVLIGRLGSVESRLVGEARWRLGRFSRVTQREAHRNAGIFPIDTLSLRFAADRLQDALGQVDLLAEWDSPYQARLISECDHSFKRCALSALEPWWHPQPWSSALAGRKVLVVHPFAVSICLQYRHRLTLFEDPEVLPDFELQTLVPPQTLGGATGGYVSWTAALDDLVHRVTALRFDVALVGCGAYGLPLAASIKAMGRPAIHMGGALQLLFGIRGRRWDRIPSFVSLMNQAWVRPLPEEIPLGAAQVDGGCYW